MLHGIVIEGTRVEFQLYLTIAEFQNIYLETDALSHIPNMNNNGKSKGLAISVLVLFIAMTCFSGASLAGNGHSLTVGNTGPVSGNAFTLATSQKTPHISDSITFPSFYKLVFSETNLPPSNIYGTEWGVKIVNVTSSEAFTQYSSTSQIIFNQPNGTYKYYVLNLSNYKAEQSTGLVNIHGKNYLIPVIFQSTFSKLTFTETGLPSFYTNGKFLVSNWEATVTNTTSKSSLHQYSNKSSLSFQLPHGDYSYVVKGAYGFTSIGSTGSVLLSSNTKVSIKFAQSLSLTNTTTNTTILFIEYGLPVNTYWTVGINSSAGVSAFTTDYEDNVVTLHSGTYVYTVSSVGPYNPTLNSTGEIIPGTNVVNVTFTYSYQPLVFKAVNLTQGTSWAVAVVTPSGTTKIISGTTNTLKYNVPNGTYSYRLINTGYYHPQNSQGRIMVNGTTYTPTNFTKVKFDYAAFPVTFNASNYQPGMTWNVEIFYGGKLLSQQSSSTGTPIVFHIQNGTYFNYIVTTSYFYVTSSPSIGSFSVNGSIISFPLSFVVYKYSVAFNPSGLPSDASWYVNLTASNGTIYRAQSSSTGTISFSVPNGTYAYAIATNNKSVSTHSRGTVTVKGSSKTIIANFSPVVYTTTIKETGLPTNTTWQLVFNGHNYTVTSNNITFPLINGTYQYKLINVKGYNATSPTGTITVKGSSSTTTVTYKAVTTTYVVHPHVPSTLPINKIVIYIFIAIGAVGLLVIFIVYTRGRRT